MLLGLQGKNRLYKSKRRKFSRKNQRRVSNQMETKNTKRKYLSRYLDRYIICERNPVYIPCYGRYVLQRYYSKSHRKSLFWGSECVDPQAEVVNFKTKLEAVGYLNKSFIGQYKDYAAVAKVTNKGLRRIYPIVAKNNSRN